jgi:hypothetical protein
MSNLYPDVSNPRGKTSLYSGFVPGIDLRREMDILMNEYGHYVIIRHFDKTKRSVYWNNVAKEAVGGPAWEFTDYITLSRRVSRSTLTGTTAGLEMPNPAGLLDVPYITFYIKWNGAYPHGITNSDIIMQFEWSKTTSPSVDEALTNVTGRYDILEAADMLGDMGRREYYICITRSDLAGK